MKDFVEIRRDGAIVSIGTMEGNSVTAQEVYDNFLDEQYWTSSVDEILASGCQIIVNPREIGFVERIHAHINCAIRILETEYKAQINALYVDVDSNFSAATFAEHNEKRIELYRQLVDKRNALIAFRNGCG